MVCVFPICAGQESKALSRCTSDQRRVFDATIYPELASCRLNGRRQQLSKSSCRTVHGFVYFIDPHVSYILFFFLCCFVGPCSWSGPSAGHNPRLHTSLKSTTACWRNSWRLSLASVGWIPSQHPLWLRSSNVSSPHNHPRLPPLRNSSIW